MKRSGDEKFSRRMLSVFRIGVAVCLLPLFTGTAVAAEYTFTGTGAPWNVGLSDITNATLWSSGEMPSSGNDYIVAGSSSTSRYCGLGITAGTFPGDSLHVRKYGFLVVKCSSSVVKSYEFPRGGLCLEGGTVLAASAWNKYVLNGKVTVGDNTANPIQASGGGVFGIDFTGSFEGGAGATINVSRWSDDSNAGTYNVSFLGDMSGYAGHVVVAGATKQARVLFGTSGRVNAITVNAAGCIGPCSEGTGLGELSVSDLELKAGATLLLGMNRTTNGIVRVSDRLTLPADGKITINLSSYEETDNFRYAGVRRPLLIAPAGTDLTADSFVFSLPSSFPGWVKGMRCELVVEKTETSEVLYWVLRNSCALRQSDNAWNGYSCFLPEYASHWSGMEDGEELNPEYFYYVNGFGASTPKADSGFARFGGWALCISGASKLYLYQSADIDRLIMNPGGRLFYLGTHMSRTLRGTVRLIDYENNGNYVYFYGRGGGRVFYIESELIGEGGLCLSTHVTELGAGSPVFQFSATNTSFSGRLRISNASAPTHVTTLKIADGRSLGGPMDAFTYNGIELRAGSRLTVTQPTELSETTRGFYVYGLGAVNVPGASHEMKVRSGLTMEGTLVKEGAGVLALGGGVCLFTSELSDVPLVGTNVLEVADGRIKALSKDAFNGLAVKFAEGTGLEVEMPSATAEDVREYGLCNTRWEAPFDLSGCGGELSVVLKDVSAIQEGDSVTIALFTVSATAANGLRGNVVFSDIPRHRVDIVERANADGSVTFLADIAPSGFAIIVR